MLVPSQQIAKAVLMVRPTDFKYAPISAQDNHFMGVPQMNALQVHQSALQEFDRSIQTLRDSGVQVIAFDKDNYPSLKGLDLPDAVYPNNHFSTWENGDITVYPMKSEEREREKKTHPYIIQLMKSAGFKVNNIVDLKKSVNNLYAALESTGSLILDRVNKIVYVSLSQRSTLYLLDQWAKLYDYEQVTFHSKDLNGKDIFHTNMMLSIGDNYVIICTEVINPEEREYVVKSLSQYREVIEISAKQCLEGNLGNCLQVLNSKGENILVMSAKAQACLTDDQRKRIEKYSKIVALPLKVIEDVGGGSARCMLAEIFNPLE